MFRREDKQEGQSGQGGGYPQGSQGGSNYHQARAQGRPSPPAPQLSQDFDDDIPF